MRRYKLVLERDSNALWWVSGYAEGGDGKLGLDGAPIAFKTFDAALKFARKGGEPDPQSTGRL